MTPPDATSTLSHLLEIERCDTLTLAASVAYVQALLAEIEPTALASLRNPVDGSLGLALRLRARARELDRLAFECARSDALHRGPGAAASELAFGPMTTLAEGYELRAMSLERAAEQARSLHREEVESTLRRQLEQTEHDGRIVLAAAIY